jgi:hypothetical protein
MAIDSPRFGEAAARFMDELEAEFGPDAELTHFAFIAAVDNKDDTVSVKFAVSAADGGPVPRYVTRGLMEEVQTGLTQQD